VAEVKVVWTRLALKDLNHARDYIARDRPAAAQKMAELIETGVQALADFPRLGRSGRIPGTRELVLSGTPFIAVYRVAESRVEVIALFHGRRRWPESV
jgi:toxin ParE1/3/4